MVRMEDYRGSNGELDWEAYRAAEKAAGEVCYQCSALLVGNIINPPKTPKPQLCGACTSLNDSNEEVDHEDYIRCPKCRNRMSVKDFNYCHEEGEHVVTCSGCHVDFMISTRVEYTFTSPEIVDHA